jgi:hypothetical protein
MADDAATPPAGRERIDVAILHHPTTDANRPIVIPAMGLFSLAEVLDRNGIPTQIVHLGLEPLVAPSFSVGEFLLESGARIAAFSAHWFFQLPDTLRLAKELKEQLPDLLVVLGGYSASFFAREIIEQHSAVDVVVRGDGEIPLLQLCRRHLDTGTRDFRDVPNVVCRVPGVGVAVSSHEYVASAAELDGFRFANLTLLRNHDRYVKLCPAPSRRFRDRLHFEHGGIFPLETGRGCPYGCTFCGGNREAQRLINFRTKPIFRSIDSVMATIREAMQYGYRAFYSCFDPDPNGPYYLELFERLRREQLDLRFIFGAWGLPDRRFIDQFQETFQEGMFEVSPETSNEALRRRNKGPLSFSNAELAECVGYMEDRGVFCQLFFGYFLAGDTVETVQDTQRFAHEYDRGGCETFYLALSSDPGSLLHLHPEEHEVEMGVVTLQDYLEALSRFRLTPNLLAHRPRSLAPAEADDLVRRLTVDEFAHKVLAMTMPAVRALLVDRADAAMDNLWAALKEDLDVGANELRPDRLLERVGSLIRDGFPDRPEVRDLLCELAEYETVPYLVLEGASSVGAHYTSYCHEIALDGASLREFLSQHRDTATVRDFRFDVKAVMGQLRRGHLPAPAPQPTRLGFAVERTGKFVVFYADPSGELVAVPDRSH